MKFLRLLLFVLTAGIVFTSCQKELSAETGSALGTLTKDAGGNCTGSSPSGAYKKDTALNATNFVDVQVDITNVGIYIISTDTVNGYYFRATGVTPVPGANTIRLIGFGKPLAAGTNLFKVKFNGDVCEFPVTVTGTTGGGGTNAIFTFANTGAACTGAIQTNNFYVGLPTNPSTHTITINANVTIAGTYTLTTNAVNGLTFSASSSFTGTGIQPIVLRATGTPTAAVTTSYTFTTTSPASSCGFDLTVQAAPTPATFTFNCGTPTFTGTYEEGTNTAGGTLKIQVTSVAGGACTITSDNQNGVTFSGSAVLAASPTPQDVILNASGTPLVAGPFTYAITGVGGTGACSVSQTYTGAPAATGVITAFVNGSTTLSTFNLNASGDLTSTGGNSSLVITGETSSASNSPFITLSVNKAGTIDVGTYTASSFTNAAFGQYDDTAGNTFNASLIGGTLTINVTSITTTAPLRIKGTFSGTMKDGSGLGTNTAVFTTGNFDVPYQ
jgi:hypothetical protein